MREIGTGSGYQAAILAELAGEVYTMEILAPLAHRAEAALNRLGYGKVKIKVGDGYPGWPEHAPCDAVIVTCAPERIPQALVEQLREGARRQGRGAARNSSWRARPARGCASRRACPCASCP